MKWFFFFLIFFTPQRSPAKLVEKTVAFVGEEILLLTDLNLFRKQLKANVIPDSLLFKLYPKKTLIKNKSLRLEFMVLQKMLAKISSNQIPLPPKDFIQTGKTKNKAFIKSLKSVGLNSEKFWKQVDSYGRTDLLLSQKVASKITISDQEIDAYHFSKYGQKLFKDFEYEFRSVSVTNNSEGKKRLEHFLKALSKSSFKKALQEKRLKAKTVKLKSSEINPKMFQSLKSLSISQISNPLPIGNSLYLLQLIWKTPFLTTLKQKKREQIEIYLYEKELKKELKKWLKKQRASFPIKIHFP